MRTLKVASLILLIALSSFYLMLLPSNAEVESPRISDVIAWGTHNTIIVQWNFKGDSDQLKEFRIYRGIAPVEKSVYLDWGRNDSYNSYRIAYSDYRYIVDANVGIFHEYVYKVVPVMKDGSKLGGLVTGASVTHGDYDNDGIPDFYETLVGLDNNDPTDGPIDSDGDGFTNYIEYLYGSNPCDRRSTPIGGGIYQEGRSKDMDLDGMSNEWETQYNLNPMDSADAFGDLDQDGISNLEEFLNETRPDIPEEVIEKEKIKEVPNNDWKAFLVLILILVALSIFGFDRRKFMKIIRK